MSETPADTVSETVYSALYDDDEARVCKDVPESACQHQPRNWVFSTLSLSLTKTGDALVDPKLTLTWLLGALGAPAFLIGLLAPVREAGALLLRKHGGRCNRFPMSLGRTVRENTQT